VIPLIPSFLWPKENTDTLHQGHQFPIIVVGPEDSGKYNGVGAAGWP